LDQIRNESKDGTVEKRKSVVLFGDLHESGIPMGDIIAVVRKWEVGLST